MLIKLERPTY